tara:strand:+ start:504 stop:1004 length:501 start_codon:yes stop_codon:yes gene_type:complete
MKVFICSLFLLAFMLPAGAQEFKVPKEPKMEKAEDYKAYEEDVLACINWLSSHGPEEESSKRKKASAFLLLWLTGTPAVSMELHAEMIEYSEKNPELLILFMGGWAKYVLETGDKDATAGNVAGLEMVINYYNQYKDQMSKDRSLKKLSKKMEGGELKTYVEESLN